VAEGSPSTTAEEELNRLQNSESLARELEEEIAAVSRPARRGLLPAELRCAARRPPVWSRFWRSALQELALPELALPFVLPKRIISRCVAGTGSSFSFRPIRVKR